MANFAIKNFSRANHISNPTISISSQTILVPVENSRYLLFLYSLVFGHKLFLKDGTALLDNPYKIAFKHALGWLKPEESPWVKSEVSLIRIGSLSILGVPGEIFPELVIGGYDGSYRFHHPLIKPDNPNPPNLSHAPQGPYLWNEIPGKIKIVAGLANDELGYIIPNYDFKFTHNLIMEPRPKGDHYEETNSIGPSITDILMKALKKLLNHSNEK